jgi:hypothetical protein
VGPMAVQGGDHQEFWLGLQRSQCTRWIAYYAVDSRTVLEAGGGYGLLEEGGSRPTCAQRATLCIWEEKEGCVLRVDLPRSVAILPWDGQLWDCAPTEGCYEAPGTEVTPVGQGRSPSWVWRFSRLVVTQHDNLGFYANQFTNQSGLTS